MNHILITTIVAALLVGCAKNDIKLTNKSAKDWQEIEIKAGGQVFEVKKLKGRATETLRFKSKAEDGGQVSGELDRLVHKIEFGYFTPNLSNRHEIIFDDNGTITIVAVP
ncbi:MAG: hypothetical protein ACJ06V_05945 [Verrucomicrobiota bacterium]